MVISLVGLTGTGKTAIGRQLAARLRFPFVDLDEQIVRKEGRTIPEIFASEGEIGFRTIESKLLQTECVPDKRAVLSTGGGIILRAENRRHLTKSGPVIWLDAPLEVIAHRVGADKNRPLIHGPNPLERVREMDQQRRDLYRSCASFSVDTSRGDIEEIVDEIMEYLSESGHV